MEAMFVLLLKLLLLFALLVGIAVSVLCLIFMLNKREGKLRIAKCPACSAVNDAKNAYCFKCGAQLGAVGVAPVGGVVCAHCGTRNEKGALFCESCGQKIEKKTTVAAGKVCGACGKPNDGGAKFCLYCRADLSKPIMAGEPAAESAIRKKDAPRYTVLHEPEEIPVNTPLRAAMPKPITIREEPMVVVIESPHTETLKKVSKREESKPVLRYTGMDEPIKKPETGTAEAENMSAKYSGVLRGAAMTEERTRETAEGFHTPDDLD